MVDGALEVLGLGNVPVAGHQTIDDGGINSQFALNVDSEMVTSKS